LQEETVCLHYYSVVCNCKNSFAVNFSVFARRPARVFPFYSLAPRRPYHYGRLVFAKLHQGELAIHQAYLRVKSASQFTRRNSLRVKSVAAARRSDEQHGGGLARQANTPPKRAAGPGVLLERSCSGARKPRREKVLQRRVLYVVRGTLAEVRGALWKAALKPCEWKGFQTRMELLQPTRLRR
jgi:hypothetical protein